jgi:alkylation response protein AidB-like acyl-CoA dehydrogenase
MTGAGLIAELRSGLRQEMPLPAGGETAQRHLRLMEFGRRNLSLARLAEAHYDAIAILAEANCSAAGGAIYGVWASEIPGKALELLRAREGLFVRGSKMFCSGGSLIDKALVTVTNPEPRLIVIDLRSSAGTIVIDDSPWKTRAFQETRTATVTFSNTPVSEADIIGTPGWYLKRPGFWHGATGPAACWAGGAEGLVDYALNQTRKDSHTLAHLAAMQASVWAMRSFLESAGRQIDEYPDDTANAQRRALIVRHVTEQACTDILRRFARAYGPYPLSMDEEIINRYQELDLYLRQSHAERDLETLARLAGV